MASTNASFFHFEGTRSHYLYTSFAEVIARMIRTSVDAGVLIVAARGTGTGAERALQVLILQICNHCIQVIVVISITPNKILIPNMYKFISERQSSCFLHKTNE